jgi:hypothetical protein
MRHGSGSHRVPEALSSSGSGCEVGGAAENDPVKRKEGGDLQYENMYDIIPIL